MFFYHKMEASHACDVRRFTFASAQNTRFSFSNRIMRQLVRFFLSMLLSTAGRCAPFFNSPRSSDDNANIFASLHNTNTAIERNLALASAGGNKSFIFDFNNPPHSAVTINSGGKFVSANVGTFPALFGVSSAMNVGTVAPCGVVATHIHPRADEFVIVVEGRLLAQSITETGSILISNELNEFTVTLFTQGAFHAQHNPDCTEAKFIAAFNSNDPGASPIAPNYFLFDDNVVLGGLGVGNGTDFSDVELESIRNHIPVGNFAVEDCLQKCGLPSRRRRK